MQFGQGKVSANDQGINYQQSFFKDICFNTSAADIEIEPLNL